MEKLDVDVGYLKIFEDSSGVRVPKRDFVRSCQFWLVDRIETMQFQEEEVVSSQDWSYFQN